MHGLGNNYIFVNEFAESLPEEELSEIAIRVANVNTGIGSDGLILIGPSRTAAFRMRIFNADGSEGKNCGNGLRCVAKYVVDRNMIATTSFSIETLGGIVNVDAVRGENGKVREVTVDMGEPRLRKRDLPMLGEPDSTTIDEPHEINGHQYRMTAVSMGNPHAVMFVSDVNQVAVAEIGPRIETCALFPERVNVEFIAVKNRREIDFRVWERGSGITQACGTGACAAVVSGVLNGKLDKGVPVTVHLLGGDLAITWGEDGHIYMLGPAETVAVGEFLL
ncbi:MAG TPA: diaminopimelate epimerase [Bacilli bacterium]